MLKKLKSDLDNYVPKLKNNFKNCFSKLKGKFKIYFSRKRGPKIVAISLVVMFAIAITIYSMKKDITVVIDGKEHKYVTYKSNLKEVLSSKAITIGLKDKVKPSLDSKVKDGQIIKIKKAVDIEINTDGKTLKIKSAEKNISDMLDKEGIALSDTDKISPSKDTALKKDINVVITRVDSKITKETKQIEFSVIKKKDDNLEKGKTKVVQTGQKGEKEITTKVVYEDGKEVSRKVMSEKVVKAPVNQVENEGTLGVLVASRGGTVKYKTNIKAKATAYTANYKSTGKSPGDSGFGMTAIGTRVKRNPSGYSSIAVDPRVIPLGTRLYIPGYGYGVAEDTGGAIKGNKIDLYFNSESEANNWGVRSVDVYILK